MLQLKDGSTIHNRLMIKIKKGSKECCNTKGQRTIKQFLLPLCQNAQGRQCNQKVGALETWEELPPAPVEAVVIEKLGESGKEK